MLEKFGDQSTQFLWNLLTTVICFWKKENKGGIGCGAFFWFFVLFIFLLFRKKVVYFIFF
jgi:hypothetical protein